MWKQSQKYWLHAEAEMVDGGRAHASPAVCLFCLCPSSGFSCFANMGASILGGPWRSVCLTTTEEWQQLICEARGEDMMLGLTACPKLRTCVLNALCFEYVLTEYGHILQDAVCTSKTSKVWTVAVVSDHNAVAKVPCRYHKCIFDENFRTFRWSLQSKLQSMSLQEIPLCTPFTIHIASTEKAINQCCRFFSAFFIHF